MVPPRFNERGDRKMKKNRGMILAFSLPLTFSLIIMYLYPVARTVLMSFFKIESVTSSMSTWSLFFALLFAVILTSGVRFKKFFRAAIYLPNVISAVALATMWVQYVYSNDYGMLNKVLEFFGLDGVKWLSSDNKFWAMLLAYMFGAVGYYMLIFISGIERIPADLYEAATIDGANKVQQFFKMTLPLLKGIIKTNITFYSVHTTAFFLWTKMFSPVNTEASTIVPVVYLYDTVFGSMGNTGRDAGAGAAVGVVLTLIIILVYFVMNKVLKDDDLEF